MPQPNFSNSVHSVNFSTPINKIFPSPLTSAIVFLVHNVDGDLSLYRKNVHVWSAGRFKSLIDVQWSSDGKFIAIQCEKKVFLYCAEDGKRISALDRSGTCRWFKLENTHILAVIDYKSHIIRWSVNCEFELKGGRLLLTDKEDILDVKIDEDSNDLLVLQSNSALTRLSFPFKDTEKDPISVLEMSKLSKHLQNVLRVSEEVKNQFLKLLKLDDAIFTKISEMNSAVSFMRNLLLFGGNISNSQPQNDSPLSQLTETNVMEWKSRLKKQHAELLVSVEESSNVLRSFQTNFTHFCPAEVDKFLQIHLPSLENRSRNLQHILAEYLTWLEFLVIPDANNQTGTKYIKSMVPESLALELAKSLNRSEEFKAQRITEWLGCFEDLKVSLDSEFKTLVNKINSVDLVPIGVPIDQMFKFNNFFNIDSQYKYDGKVQISDLKRPSFTLENNSTKLIIR